MAKSQLERIAEMKAEVAALGGVIAGNEDLPPNIEEDLLRRTLNKPGGYRFAAGSCAACVEEYAAGNEHELPHTCER